MKKYAFPLAALLLAACNSGEEITTTQTDEPVARILEYTPAPGQFINEEARSGGAFDNAKKYIESGSLEGHGKGSDAHKASVVGDTVGDTRKDVVGVALDIFIKTMSTVANTLATVFQHITLIR